MNEIRNQKNTKRIAPFWRALLEAGFIVFLFYSNLLMGEYTHSGLGHTKGLIWAVQDIFSYTNFIIAIVLSLIGYLFFEYLRIIPTGNPTKAISGRKCVKSVVGLIPNR